MLCVVCVWFMVVVERVRVCCVVCVIGLALMCLVVYIMRKLNNVCMYVHTYVYVLCVCIGCIYEWMVYL